MIFIEFRMISWVFLVISIFFRAFQADGSHLKSILPRAVSPGFDEPAELVVRPETRSQSHDCGWVDMRAAGISTGDQNRYIPGRNPTELCNVYNWVVIYYSDFASGYPLA